MTANVNVSALRVGDVIRNPFRRSVPVRILRIAPGMYGLVELTTVDVDGLERSVLMLDPDETVEVQR